MTGDPRSPIAYDQTPAGLASAHLVPSNFNHDPSAILTALRESHGSRRAPPNLLILLSLGEIQNIVFPPHEGREKWRFAYARVEAAGMGTFVTSKIYFSRSRDRVMDIASNLPVVCLNQYAFRDEIGAKHYDLLSPQLMGLTAAPKTSMTIVSSMGKVFHEKGFGDRPIREWARHLVQALPDFIQSARIEARLKRYPWEAASDHMSPLQREVEHKMIMAGDDPDSALRAALALA